MIALSLPMSQAARPAKPDIAEGGELRLNLGGRDKKVPGFLTVDLLDGPDTDIVADCADLCQIKENSVLEIYASNILEHFPHPKTARVLKEWQRILVPRGTLYLSVPDFDAVVKLYQQYGMLPWIRNQLYGDQIYDLAFHYTCFTFASLAAVCNEVGFSDIKRVQFLPQRIEDCSRNIDSLTRKSVCVNALVTK